MVGITSKIGISSGLDIQGIVEALVSADIAPTKNKINLQEARYNSTISTLGQLKSAFDKLKSSVHGLVDIKKFSPMSYNTSNASALGVTLNTDGELASPGKFQIKIKTLAAQQTLSSSVFTNKDTPVGTGTMTINFGTYSNTNTTFTPNTAKTAVTINLQPGHDKLSDIRDAINQSQSGLQANIIQDSQGARLTIISADSGENMAMKINVTETNGPGLSALAYDPTQNITALSEKVAAKNSTFDLNGIALTNSSNHLKNIIEGVDLDLKIADLDKMIDLSIDKNQGQVISLLNDFIKQYNETMTLVNNLTGYNKDTKQAGVMQSDSSTQSLKFNLNQLLSKNVTTSDPAFKSLTDLGIKTNAQGLLTIADNKKFQDNVDKHFNDIGLLFSKSAKATDGNIRIKSIGDTIKEGTYHVDITEYTPGTSVAGKIGSATATSSGDGKYLNGAGEMKGLNLELLGGTLGQRGSVAVQDGLAARIDSLLDGYLDGKTGVLTKRIDSLNTRVKTLNKDRQILERRTLALEKRYFKKFNDMDALVGKIRGASDALSQQLNALSNSRG
jgi:flagellar hook-associated protein 2